MRPRLQGIALAVSCIAAACSGAAEPAAPILPDIATAAPPAPSIASAVASSPSPPADHAPPLGYPWLVDPGAPIAVGALVDRFEPPAGFSRVELAPSSFGAWLRGLPLEAPGSAVLSYRGAVILAPDHPNLAAVVAIDVGTADLQQCADSILRLHAEWRFARGRRDQSYRAASGAAMPFARWARGERMIPEGLGFRWTASARPDASHAGFRKWLDGVFAYANTGSLARDAARIELADLRPGDFVVQAGAPGHAVLVLDLARAPDGRFAVLLGQGFMPAQSFHVLRPARASRGAWFVVEPGDRGLDTPFWAAFPWTALRRLPED